MHQAGIPVGSGMQGTASASPNTSHRVRGVCFLSHAPAGRYLDAWVKAFHAYHRLRRSKHHAPFEIIQLSFDRSEASDTVSPETASNGQGVMWLALCTVGSPGKSALPASKRC